MSRVVASSERSISVAVDARLHPRAAVKRAAAALVDRCHVLLDLDADGRVVVTLGLPPGADPEELRHLAGHLGNLLVADLVERGLDPRERGVRNLLLARALDGALPRDPRSSDRSEPPGDGGREAR